MTVPNTGRAYTIIVLCEDHSITTEKAQSNLLSPGCKGKRKQMGRTVNRPLRVLLLLLVTEWLSVNGRGKGAQALATATPHSQKPVVVDGQQQQQQQQQQHRSAAFFHPINPSPTYSRSYTFSPNGSVGNATEMTFYQVYMSNGVVPPHRAPARVWRWVAQFHRKIIPLLHWRDPVKPQDSALSLACLWWKAMVGLDRSSRAHDGGLASRLLPRATRWIVQWFRALFPRFNHANIELRTVLLDRYVNATISEHRQQLQQQNNNATSTTPVWLVCMGAGYDLRSIRLRRNGIIDHAIEMDLESVVLSKQRLIQYRLCCQHENDNLQNFLPHQMIAVDFNNTTQVAELLSTQVLPNDHSNMFTIFLFEGVLVHLKQGAGHALLQTCSEALQLQNLDGAIVFADLLDNVTNRSLNMVQRELYSTGWILEEYLASPTKTPHTGRARLATKMT